MSTVVVTTARHRSFDRANTAMTKNLSTRYKSSELLALYATVSQRRRGIGRLFPKNLLLGDHVIHELDIVLALGRAPTFDDHVIKAVLQTEVTVPNPFVPAKRTAHRLNLIATDIDWRSRRYADGPTVSGPGWAIASVLANRPKALSQLDGDGVSVLSRRLADHGHMHPDPNAQ